MLDTIIRGGDVVMPHGVVQCDVAIAGARSGSSASSRRLGKPILMKT
jgi:hypothetical protein